jgi:hypothetical protein
MNADTKVELIKKITALPELPSGDDERVDDIFVLLTKVNDILSDMLVDEEQRARNWQTTVEALEAADRGELKTYGTIEQMFADLHADD